MSDPVTNVEIEDVLSSIRKLVAEEARTAPVVRKRAEPDRLVLTPAQRVPDSPEPSQDAAGDADPIVLTQTVEPVSPVAKTVEERPIDDIPLDARLADFGEVEGSFPDIDDYERVRATAGADEVEPVEESDKTSDRLELGRLIEEEVAAALTEQDDFEAESEEVQADVHDTTDAEDEHDNWNVPLDGSFEHVDDDAALEEDHSLEEPDVDEQVEADSDIVSPPQTLEDKIAALGRLVARDTGEFEEDRDVPTAPDLVAVAAPVQWEEAHLDTAGAEIPEDTDVASDKTNVLRSDNAWPQDESLDPQLTSEPDASDTEVEAPEAEASQSDTAVLQFDEDMLRSMVGEIVRQELQGALGERITRNVRKLVRREIHRMLVSQELD